MGRGPRNQSRPIGPDTVGPRAGRASGPRPTLAGARGPRHRLTLAASSPVATVRGGLVIAVGGLPEAARSSLPD